jgi:predicted transcriptional regulator
LPAPLGPAIETTSPGSIRKLTDRSAARVAPGGLLDRLFKGEVAPLVAHFAENEQLTAKDIRQLKALIAKIEEDK